MKKKNVKKLALFRTVRLLVHQTLAAFPLKADPRDKNLWIPSQSVYFQQKPSYMRSRLPVLGAVKFCMWSSRESCRRTLPPRFSDTLSPGSASLQPSSTFSGSQSNPTYTAKSSSLPTNHFLPLCLSSMACKSRVRTLAWSSLKQTHAFFSFWFFFFLEIFKKSSNPICSLQNTAQLDGVYSQTLVLHLFFWVAYTTFFFSFCLTKSQSTLDLKRCPLWWRGMERLKTKFGVLCAKSSKPASKSFSIYTLKQSIWACNWHPFN